ncbi:nucleotide-diphospho-sugar transferase [Aureobasidium pullulans]|uniref:glycogenin glucosyltransferase n=1 Tax=Aureobasidium pullulans TaxID=5580 RepID=A0A4S8Y7R3_AURPU|nr:nucleotide-diphospho-sugar transferase [Aureobasidium pullulans]THW29845.1 nucleotide-diphospho-sugar transferase [Aureobasidium pullulans]THW46670.1 nucleotide-diphospho-sugar transferase [Aureobasidium pullulans]THX91767.1 nucleotide-diphospho-sugar transferase [Aureobasidium pullulans]THY46101.1 nucleotide-diphospho-sugar transferase [Aureobasidium pullulans]
MVGGTEDVYCTMVITDSYLAGAAVLAHSLRDNGTKKKLAVLVTPDSLRASTLTELKSLYDYVIPVERISSPNLANLHLMNRGDLRDAFTKINLWRQTQFRKIVYLDADTVALRAPDELFDIEASFAGAPDVGWPDAFNTGVMVLKPHMGDYWALKTLAATGDSFDGADQGLLNQYFEHKNWHRLSFIYNCTPSANYQYEPAYRYHKSRIAMVHFIGKNKPWTVARSQGAAPGAYNELLYRWWAVYDRHFKEPVAEYTSGRYSPASSPIAAPEASVLAVEGDPAEQRELGEEFGQGRAEPTPTAEQRRFTAPQAEWDATRMEPPTDSKPEAANFPTTTYAFNQDKDFFRPPKAYPEPPKDMWYEVPKTKPDPAARPKPIFPWEERQDTRPTRKFVEDVDSPDSVPQPGVTIPSADYTSSLNNSPATPIIKITTDDPWQDYTSNAKNAWDDIAGIDAYIRKFNDQQFKSRTNSTQIQSPSTNTQFERRESLILTDFPTELERPSLPVTPAPIRRTNFWANERNNNGQLPSAEGVPEQADWDPTEKLEELRRGSVTMPLDLKMPEKKIPSRAMPSTAPAFYEKNTATSSTQGSNTQAGPSSSPSAPSTTPQFNNPGFSNSSSNSKAEDVLSPTEHGSRQF